MIEVTHHIQPRVFGVPLFTYGKDIKVPCTWAELSTTQAVRFAEMVLLYQRPFGEYQRDMQLHYLGLIIGLPQKKYYQLTDLQVAILVRKIQPLFDATGPAADSIKTIAVAGNRYYTPGKDLHHLTLGAWAMAEEYYNEIQEGRDVRRNTALLCATLVAKKRRGKRVKYDTDVAESMADKMLADDGMTFAEQFAIYHYYWACRQVLIKKYKKVFKKSADSDNGVDLTSQYRWVGMIHHLAEQGAFGDWEKTADTDVHTVLHYLNYNADKMREFELRNKLS